VTYVLKVEGSEISFLTALSIFYPAILNLFWPHFIGGCETCRDTGRFLREAGAWSEIDVYRVEGEGWQYVMPNIIGVLTK
jgi:hypothetical protein